VNTISRAKLILSYHDDGQLVHKDEYASVIRELIKLAEFKAIVCKLPHSEVASVTPIR